MRDFRAKRLQGEWVSKLCRTEVCHAVLLCACSVSVTELRASQQATATSSSEGDGAPRARTFGTVREIRTEDFLHEVLPKLSAALRCVRHRLRLRCDGFLCALQVDAELPGVTVVVHLYEPAVQVVY
jgi:hypothetical protein